MQKIFLFGLCMAIFFGWSNGDAAQKENDAAKPALSAVVLEKDGRETKVSNLSAYYVASGKWQGSPPTKSLKELAVAVYFEEDRIKLTDDFKFRFDELRQFTIGGPNDSFLYRFEKRDGTVMLFRHSPKKQGPENLYEVIDPAGTSIKLVKVDNFALSGGEVQGRTYALQGFDANAKTKSGRVGTIFFDLDKVRNIKFESEEG